MKKVLLLFALLAVTGIASAELLTNGGFEDGDTGQLGSVAIPGWNSWNGSGWHHDDAGAVIDSKAMKLWWDDAGLFQDFAATAGVSYDFSVQCMDFSGDTAAVNWNGLIKAEFYDGVGGQLLAQDLERFDSDNTVNPDDTWVQIGDSIVAPVGTVTGRIVLMAVDWHDGIGGSIQFDNASVVPEPATFALLGLGGLLLRRRRA